MTVLVTRGGGYVGSRVVKELRAAGSPCLVVDSLIHGHRELVTDADLIVSGEELRGWLQARDEWMRNSGERASTSLTSFKCPCCG